MKSLVIVNKDIVDRIPPIITLPPGSRKPFKDNETRKNVDMRLLYRLQKLLSPGGFFVGCQARSQVIFDDIQEVRRRNGAQERFIDNPEPDAIGHDLVIVDKNSGYYRLIMPRYIQRGVSNNGIFFKGPSNLPKTEHAYLEFLRLLNPIFLVVEMVQSGQFRGAKPFSFQGIDGGFKIRNNVSYWKLHGKGNTNRLQYTNKGLCPEIESYSLSTGRLLGVGLLGFKSPHSLEEWFKADMLLKRR